MKQVACFSYKLGRKVSSCKTNYVAFLQGEWGWVWASTTVWIKHVLFIFNVSRCKLPFLIEFRCRHRLQENLNKHFLSPSLSIFFIKLRSSYREFPFHHSFSFHEQTPRKKSTAAKNITTVKSLFLRQHKNFPSAILFDLFSLLRYLGNVRN